MSRSSFILAAAVSASLAHFGCAEDGEGHADAGAEMKAEIACLADAPGAFRGLSPVGTASLFAAGDSFQDELLWTYTAATENPNSGGNHFQGLARMGEYLYLAGSNETLGTGDLFVVHMASQSGSAGPPGSNLLDDGAYPATDTIVSRQQIGDAVFWHPGGVAASGSTLAVSMEGSGLGRSKTLFFDLSDPAEPTLMDYVLEHPDSDSSAVAFTQLTDGRFVVGTVSTSSFRRGSLAYRFYVSHSDDLSDGFGPARKVSGELGVERSIAGSGLAFVPQCDGGLFLVALGNTTSGLFEEGAHYANLFKVDLSVEAETASVHYQDSRVFECAPHGGAAQSCHFGAAVGGTVADGALRLYSTPPFRRAVFSGSAPIVADDSLPISGSWAVKVNLVSIGATLDLALELAASEGPVIDRASLRIIRADGSLTDVLVEASTATLETDGRFFLEFRDAMVSEADSPFGIPLVVTMTLEGHTQGGVRICGALDGDAMGISLDDSTFGGLPWTEREADVPSSCQGAGERMFDAIWLNEFAAVD